MVLAYVFAVLFVANILILYAALASFMVCCQQHFLPFGQLTRFGLPSRVRARRTRLVQWLALPGIAFGVATGVNVATAILYDDYTNNRPLPQSAGWWWLGAAASALYVTAMAATFWPIDTDWSVTKTRQVLWSQLVEMERRSGSIADVNLVDAELARTRIEGSRQERRDRRKRDRAHSLVQINHGDLERRPVLGFGRLRTADGRTVSCSFLTVVRWTLTRRWTTAALGVSLVSLPSALAIYAVVFDGSTSDRIYVSSLIVMPLLSSPLLLLAMRADLLYFARRCVEEDLYARRIRALLDQHRKGAKHEASNKSVLRWQLSRFIITVTRRGADL